MDLRSKLPPKQTETKRPRQKIVFSEKTEEKKGTLLYYSCLTNMSRDMKHYSYNVYWTEVPFRTVRRREIGERKWIFPSRKSRHELNSRKFHRLGILSCVSSSLNLHMLHKRHLFSKLYTKTAKICTLQCSVSLQCSRSYKFCKLYRSNRVFPETHASSFFLEKSPVRRTALSGSNKNTSTQKTESKIDRVSIYNRCDDFCKFCC